MQLDYAPLSNLYKLNAQYRRAEIFLVLFGAWAIALIFFLNRYIWIWLLFAGLLIVPLVKSLRAYLSSRNVYYRARFDFASANNLTYKETSRLSQQSTSSLFDLEGYGSKTDVFIGEFAGLPMQLFDYSLYGDSKDSKNTYGQIRVMHIKLPVIYPHFIIDCLLEPDDFGKSALPVKFDKSQKIQLEGEFYKYFSVYAPEQKSTDALALLAPDLMICLLRMKSFCDIEINGNDMYFYWPSPEQSEEGYRSVFETAEAVVEELQTNMHNYQNASKSNGTYTEIVARAVPENNLLKSRVDHRNIVITAGSTLLLYLFVFVFVLPDEPNASFVLMFFTILLPVILLFGLYTLLVNRKKRRLNKILDERYRATERLSSKLKK